MSYVFSVPAQQFSFEICVGWRHMLLFSFLDLFATANLIIDKFIKVIVVLVIVLRHPAPQQ